MHSSKSEKEKKAVEKRKRKAKELKKTKKARKKQVLKFNKKPQNMGLLYSIGLYAKANKSSYGITFC